MNNLNSGKELENKVLVALQPYCQIQNITTGFGWIGDGKPQRTGNKMILVNPRPLKAGFKGCPDQIGFTTVKITPDMVGQEIAVFTAIEVKDGKGRLSKDQQGFLNIVNRAGGIGAEVRSVEDAIQAVHKFGPPVGYTPKS